MIAMISKRPAVAVAFAAATTVALANPPEEAAMPAYIGVAEMKADGSIVMHLRAEGPGGIVGHSLLTYPPGHPQYLEILEHVGPMKPGDTAAVKPWPDPPR
jgi:hypothetical protein